MRASLARRLAASVTGLLVVSLAVPALPQTVCFQPPEIEADQAIRYQTQVMVLSDACGTTTYRDFTVHAREAIVAYDKTMMNHFRRTGARNPQASLDSFLTQLANEASLANGAELAQTLCGRTAPFLAEAQNFTSVQFRERATQLASANGGSYRRCER